MTLPAFASTDDLADRLPGGLRDADLVRAQAALDDASTLIRGETRRTWVTDNALALPTGDDEWKAAVLVGVCLKAALRSFENPEIFDQETGNSGSVDVYLTRAEKRLLRSVVGSSGIGVIELEAGTPGWTGDFIAVFGQDEPLPFTYAPLRR